MHKSSIGVFWSLAEPIRFLAKGASSPLGLFVVLGAALFGLYAWLRPASHLEVVVPAGVVRALVDAQGRGAGGGDSARAAGAIDAWVEDEVLFREARALGLDRGDPVVRRRLAQSMRFLLEGRAEEPTTAQLEAYLAAHPRAFAQAERLDLEHVFFAKAVGPEALDRALFVLRAGADPTGVGEPFATGRTVKGASYEDLTRRFGGAFATAVFAAPGDSSTPPQWRGGVTSVFGQHLVRVSRREEARTPQLASVRERVRSAFEANRREVRVAEALRGLRARYRVTVPSLTAATADRAR